MVKKGATAPVDLSTFATAPSILVRKPSKSLLYFFIISFAAVFFHEVVENFGLSILLPLRRSFQYPPLYVDADILSLMKNFIIYEILMFEKSG